VATRFFIGNAVPIYMTTDSAPRFSRGGINPAQISFLNMGKLPKQTEPPLDWSP
jgi:hypothetical protein